MREILLDFKWLETPGQVQDYLAAQLELPQYYGKNLDALYDCLTELSEDTCILVSEAGEESEIDLYLKRVKRVLQDAEEENPHLYIGCLEQLPGKQKDEEL